MRIKDVRKSAVSALRELGNTEPAADTDFLLSKLLGFSKTDIILGDKELSFDMQKTLSNALVRLKNGEPVQYIAGKCEFMSLEFEVSPAVLIPRSDTEVLVETVMELCREKSEVNILDIGCGSGCISLSLAHYLKNVSATALDISAAALNVAKRNAKRLGVSGRVHFLQHDILGGFPDLEILPDIIVSNPPYIPSRDIENLEKKVKGFEPFGALSGGDDGLVFYRRIAETAKLSHGGILAFEIGINQADSVREILENRFKNIKFIKDINKIDRVVVAEYPKN